MRWSEKVSWRLDLLRSKAAGWEVFGWGAVLREIFRSHGPQNICNFAVSRRGEMLLLTAPNGMEIHWLAEYDHRFVPLWYEEIYGPRGCIYELPGKVAVRPGDWVVDGGACEGFFALYCLAKGASVVCVEPNPPVARALRETLAPFLRDGRARVAVAALGDEPGEVELLQNLANASVCTVLDVPSEGGLSSTVRVPMVTLDRLVEELGLPRVDLVKLDVEGAERQVIKGAADTIRRFVPAWAVACYHRPDDHRVLPQLLREVYKDYETVLKGAVACGFRVSPSVEAGRPYLRPLVLFGYTPKEGR